jgi:hypothetical protein
MALKVTTKNVDMVIAESKKMGWVSKIDGKNFYHIGKVEKQGHPNHGIANKIRALGYYVRIIWWNVDGGQHVFARRK